MNNYVLIKRLALIIEKLSGRYAPSLKELKEYLEQEGFEGSMRTLQRDFERLRVEFGIEVVYNPEKNSYYIDNENSLHLDALLRLIHLGSTSEVLMQSLKERDKTLALLAFQKDVKTYAGSQYLESIFTAIKECRIISFEHENFEKNKISKHRVKPLMLKEYSDKWYLVCAMADSNCIRIFGLDRMRNIQMEEKKFKAAERKAVDGLFDNVIGLVYDMEKPTTVRLSVTPGQAKYFKTAPLHQSQEIEKETASEVIFSYFLSPNRELQRLILGFGVQVKVLEPAWFAKQVKEEVSNMLKRYK